MACAGVWSKRFSSCFGAFAITKVICKKYINVGTKMKIFLEKIKKKYLKKEVLKDISLEIKPGSCVGILGSNGCGKSTLLKILAGVLKSSGGRFLYGDYDLLENEKLRAKTVGYVPQSVPLMEELSANDNLSLWYSKDEMKKSLSSGVLGMLGIDEFLKVPVMKMSGGMQKRLSIGCAVAHNPKILLLDEPSAALDLVCKEKIAEYLKNFKENGGTVLLATHDIGELSLCENLQIMKNGVLNPFDFNGNVSELVNSL